MQKGRPIAYLSQALKGRSIALSTYEQEMLAILLAIKKWRQYLWRRRFIIRTDHQALKYLLEHKLCSGAQYKWVMKLHGYTYQVKYKKGAEDRVADGLSRRGEIQLEAITMVSADCIKQFKTQMATSSYYQRKLSKWTAGKLDVQKYTHLDGMLYYKTKLLIDPKSPFTMTMLKEHHDITAGGHSGISKTLKRLRRVCYWKGMRRMVKDYISTCEACQRSKAENVAPAGLLQPLPIHERIWEDLSMDFIEGLPTSHHKSAIMVVVDRLTKYIHIFALTHPYNANTIAQIFMDGICRLHGMPRTIISDRGTIFTSAFWRELFRLQGTELK